MFRDTDLIREFVQGGREAAKVRADHQKEERRQEPSAPSLGDERLAESFEDRGESLAEIGGSLGEGGRDAHERR